MMAIVLPRRKKRGDIFAPSKAIQDAKSKIGPAFFDVTLLECSRNAVELTKLVNQWEELDKEKVKLVKNISREQEHLLRSLKKHKANENGDLQRNPLPITPGFRFKSNGDIKKSSACLPIVHFSDQDIEKKASDQTIPISQGHSAISNTLLSHTSVFDKNSSDYESVDYANEIEELETVLKDIYINLVRNKISMSGLSSHVCDGKLKTFLRSHTNEYVPVPDSDTNDADVFAKPNDRFAYRPGSSNKRETYLHKHNIKTPSHRSCIGCQTRLRPDNNDFSKMMKSHSESLGKRRWNYVPHGKYVQSTTALHITLSQADRQSSHNMLNKKTLNRTAKSMVQFTTEKTDIPLRGAVSLATPKLTRRAVSAVMNVPEDRQVSKSGIRAASRLSIISNKSECDTGLAMSRSLNVLGYKSVIDQDSEKTSLERCIGSPLSCRSARASSARINSFFVDHKSRINLLKAVEVEESKHCQQKINEFLKKVGTKK